MSNTAHSQLLKYEVFHLFSVLYRYKLSLRFWAVWRNFQIFWSIFRHFIDKIIQKKWHKWSLAAAINKVGSSVQCISVTWIIKTTFIEIYSQILIKTVKYCSAPASEIWGFAAFLNIKWISAFYGSMLKKSHK